MKRIFCLAILFVFNVVNLISQEENPVKLTGLARPAVLNKGTRGELMVTCIIEKDFHVSDATNQLFKVSPQSIRGILFGSPEYPKGEKEEYVGFVYRDRVKIPIPMEVEKNALEGDYTLFIGVTYQLCAEKTGVCYPPVTDTVSVPISILQGDRSAGSIPTENTGIAGRLSRSLEQGSWMAFLIVFLGGLLTSLTPCVYPMIPITIAVIGSQATGGKFRGFILSLFYVLGISITFTSLGILAAKTGSLFGVYAQHPVVLVIISLIFLTMGLSMLGLFVIQMPSSLSTKLQGKKRVGFFGALLTGIVAGLIVSPCISPLLVVILTWVAKTGSVLLGAGLLFTFSLGLGVLFILIGTFSGVLKNLPKSGGWMEFIERALGTLLMVLAIFFIRPILPPHILHMIWAIFFVLFGTFVGGLTPLDIESDRKKKIGKAVGILAILIGGALVFISIFQWTGFGMGQSTKTVEERLSKGSWLSEDVEGLRQARLEKKPVLIDFFAEWCTACHELDEKTWPDAAVQDELRRYILVKLDLTRNDKRTTIVQEKYQILGMPTVIILDPEGQELDRFEGFKSAREVTAILKQF